MTSGYRIRMAEGPDTDGLKHLWRQCFDDDPAYIDSFFIRRFADGRTVCAEADGRIVGAAYLLPAHIRCGEDLYPVMYGYAVGVDPEHRRRGICEAMFRKIYAFAENENCGFFLRPASSLLARYYERIGMTIACFEKMRDYVFLSPNKEAFCALLEGNSSQYRRIRESYAPHTGALLWPESHLSYAIDENKAEKGFCQMTEDGRCFVLGKKERDTLILKELYAPEDRRKQFLQILAVTHRTSRLRVRMMCSGTENGALPALMTYNMPYTISGSLGPLLD